MYISKMNTMKKIKQNASFLLFVSLMMIIGLSVSCRDDSTPSTSGKVELFSFGPSGAQLGDTLSFIGNNLDKVSEVVFTGDSVSKANFISQTSSLIKLKIPKNVQRGYVTLRSPEGDVTSITEIDFLVPVTITSITPGIVVDAVRPGETITITGTNLNWVTSVDFYNKINNITVTDTFYVSTSATKLVITVPLAAQTGQLTFHTAGTKPQTLITEQDLNVVLPAITDISPNPVERGGALTITGTDLDLVTGVLMGGVTDTIKTFVSQSATEIVLTVPEEAAYGKVTIFPYSLVPIVSEDMLSFVGDAPILPPLDFALYDNGFQNSAQNWGWNTGDVDPSNTEFINPGSTSSCKITYTGGWGALWFANFSAIPGSSYTKLEFSVYGGPGTDGKEILITFNINDDNTKKSLPASTIVEGKWTNFSYDLDGSVDPITDIMFQDNDWSGDIYLARVGFMK